MCFLVVFFSGFTTFFPGQFTVSGLFSNYVYKGDWTVRVRCAERETREMEDVIGCASASRDQSARVKSDQAGRQSEGPFESLLVYRCKGVVGCDVLLKLHTNLIGGWSRKEA
jgi:hypothetical protein